jgi:hypothetical protein
MTENAAMTASTIDVRLEPAHFRTRRPCIFCHRTTAKDSVIAAVYEDGQWTHYVVCPDYLNNGEGCLGQPREVLAARLRKKAASLREDADALEALAADVPTVPTQAQW